MAEYTLSTRRIDRGSAPGQLNPNLISPNAGAGQISAGQINPNAGAVAYTNAPIPNAVKSQVLTGALGFMQQTSKAAFEYQEKEARFLAGEATLEYQTRARQLYSGYEDEKGNFIPGLASSKGKDAKAAYGVYTAGLNGLMEDTLEDLEPRVKQHALIALQTAKNQMLSKGATHRAAQMEQAQEDLLFNEARELSIQVADNPSMLRRDAKGNLTPNPYTGLDVRETFIRKFPDRKAGTKAWWTLIQQTGEKIALRNATDGLVFLNTIAKDELAGSMTHYTALATHIETKVYQDARRETAQEDLKIKKEKRDREKLWMRTESQVVSNRGKDTAWTSDDILEAIDNLAIDPLVGKTLWNEEFGNVYKAAIPEQILFWESSIANSYMKNGERWGLLLNGTVGPLVNQYRKDSSVNRDAYQLSRLDEMMEEVGNPTYKDVNAIMTLVEKWNAPEFGGTLGAAGRATANSLHRDRVTLWSKQGMSVENMRLKAYQELKPKGAVAPYEMLRGIPGIPTVPKDQLTIEQAAIEIKNMPEGAAKEVAYATWFEYKASIAQRDAAELANRKKKQDMQ